MAIFIRNRTELEQQLVMMKTQKGTPIRALARQFAISRNMVRRILRKHEAYRDEGHDILQPEHRAGSAKGAVSLIPSRRGSNSFWRNIPRSPERGSLRNWVPPVMTAVSVSCGIDSALCAPAPSRRR